MGHAITKGTRVAFRREFLRDTGQFTGWAPFARGTVVSMGEQLTRFKGDRGGPHLVVIAWDDGTRSRALSSNLVREDRIHLEAV